MDLEAYAELRDALPEYENWKHLDEGGAGIVFEAIHLLTGQKRAVKWYVKTCDFDETRLRPSEIGITRDPPTARRIFNHPNLVQIYESGFAGIAKYLTMEYVPGTRLSKISEKQEELTLTEIQQWMNEIIAGVQHLHTQGYAHLDLTDNNIIIGEQTKIIDTDTLEKINTPIDPTCISACSEYLTPDHILVKEYTQRTDVYTLACVLNKLMTGTTPLTRTARLTDGMSIEEVVINSIPYLRFGRPLEFFEGEITAEPTKWKSLFSDATYFDADLRLGLLEFSIRMNEAFGAELQTRQKQDKKWTVPT